MMTDGAVGASLLAASSFDLALIEGNRGLYDGFDATGTHSTAELAKKLAAPVVLVVNVTKATRTVAALVLGCRNLDPEVHLAGVILNRVGTDRQVRVITEAVEALDVPVLGAIPRLTGSDPLPGRHLGLVTFAEHPARERSLDRAADAVRDNVDLDRLLALARSAPPVEMPVAVRSAIQAPVTLGFFSDPAFSFYYPENLEGLKIAGARLRPVSPASDALVPEQIDGLYIGGGFPEVHAPKLAENTGFLEDLARRVLAGLPVYAECGGLMYLARRIVIGEASYEMAGVLDLVVRQHARPEGHGYEVGSVDRDNPFFEQGARLVGHEFHYSSVDEGSDRDLTVVDLERGQGVADRRDGVVKGNVWASYLHLHASATPFWADGFLELARAVAGRNPGDVAAWG